MTTSSRMCYAFARDGGLPASKFFAKVQPRLQVPLNALWLTLILVIIFGCIFLGSSSAFNAIVSASVVALGISYAIPPLINCLRGRKMLPASRPFKLPGWLGWTCNIVNLPLSSVQTPSNVGQQIGIAYAALTTVLFMFPPVLPVTGNNMNYCVAAFAIVLIISLIQWFVDGRKNYTGPQIDIDALKAGEILGEAPMDGGRNSTGVQSEGLGYSKSKEAEATNGIH
jgi:choline transport protein